MTQQTISKKTITAETYLRRYAGRGYEYSNGNALPLRPEIPDADGNLMVAPATLIHGLITGQVAALLSLCLRGKNLGRVLGGETGFLMSRNPPEFRSADVAFVSRERLHALRDITGYLPFPPELAVEVISEWDKAADVRSKVRSYISNGTRLLWLIYPNDREIEVYRYRQAVQVFRETDILDGGDVLPSLAISVGEIFEVLNHLKTR